MILCFIYFYKPDNISRETSEIPLYNFYGHLKALDKSYMLIPFPTVYSFS